MAHAPPGSRVHPLGPGHAGQRGESSGQAAGQFDSISDTPTVAVHLSSSVLCFTVFYFLNCFSDRCRWTKLNGAAGIGDTHSQVEL